MAQESSSSNYDQIPDQKTISEMDSSQFSNFQQSINSKLSTSTTTTQSGTSGSSSDS